MKTIVTITENLPLYKVLRVRRRHLLTRGNRLRLRYVASSLVIGVLGAGGAVSSVSQSLAFFSSGFSTESLVAQAVDANPLAESSVDVAVAALTPELPIDDEIAQDDVSEAVADEEIIEDEVEVAEVADPAEAGVEVAVVEPHDDEVAALEAKPLEPREEVLKIGTGETLVGVLQNVGVSDQDAYKVVKAMARHYDPRSVKAGQAVAVRLEPGEEGLEFAGMNLKIDPIKEVVVEKTSAADFESAIKEKKVVLQKKAAKAQIETSLYGSAARAGIPASVVAEMIRIYSYQVDFQRDIREGDKVEIMYETYETEDGDFASYGEVLYANLIVGGKGMPVYRFTPENGKPGYYTPDGKSTKKSIMRTPIDGARMSSGFGMRRHPILGYNKMHKGADFAAPRGTPIYAAGDGVIEFVGRKGAYGNYVRIRHNKTIQTAYAHMHKFAKGMSAGKKVSQGEIIGYVGSTGRSTGAHLHFELLKNNVQVNPSSVNMPDTNMLAGAELKKFKKMLAEFKNEYAASTNGVKFAQNYAVR